MQTANMQTNRLDCLIQDDMGYADDATLLIEKDTHGQIFGRMGNYDVITEARELNIQRKMYCSG